MTTRAANVSDANPSDRSTLFWLAASLGALPVIQLTQIDLDRTGLALLLAPALILGRSRLAEAWSLLWETPVVRTLVAVTMAVTVVSIMRADHVAPALVAVGSWCLMGAGILLASRMVVLDDKAVQRLLLGMAVGFAIGTILTWIYWFGSQAIIYPHHRRIGMHSLFGAMASLVLLVQADSRRQRGWYGVLGLICWSGMLWSGARMPWLGLGAGVAAWLVVAPAGLRLRVIANTAVLLVGGLLLSFALWTPEPYLGWWSAFSRTVAATSLSEVTSTRDAFWTEAFHHFQTAPWFGLGPDSYRFLLPELDGQEPHNLSIQLLLDLGLLGAVPVIGLIIIVVVRGAAAVRRSGGASTLLQGGAWAGLVGALGGAHFDGVGYHLQGLLPLSMLFAIVLPLAVNAGALPLPPRRVLLRATGIGLIVVSAIVLGLHTWLYSRLLVAPPPVTPHEPSARLLRVFPSTTFGLWRWLNHWLPDDPQSSLDWALWAQRHSYTVPLFHMYAAEWYRRHGDIQACRREMQQALATVHWSGRADVQKQLESLPE